MGEDSKRSGEIGEALAKALLKTIGWNNFIQNVSIDCNTPIHVNEKGNPRRTHGEDQIYLYNNPFHDDRSDVIHISNKNVLGGYAKGNTLKSEFKSHLKELHETMECAKYNHVVKQTCSTFKTKKIVQHSGLLIWLHNDLNEIEKGIIHEFQNIRLDLESSEPIYLVDNNRATFILNVVDSLRTRSVGGSFSFLYPKIGTAISVEENRTGSFLPIELMASDIVTAVVKKETGVQELILYTSEHYSIDSYKRMLAYALSFNHGLVNNLAIGMPDYNPAAHKKEVDEARMAFHHRTEEITTFSYKRSILDLLQERGQ